MRVHIVGAGIAGLSAAIRLQQADNAACLWEAAAQAGGRVRSFPDAKIGRSLDNGAHLLLSGNRRLLDLLTQAGLSHRLTALGDGSLRLYDRQKDECARWRPGRLGGLTTRDLWGVLRLLRAGADRSVADCLASTPGWQRLWHPLALASLNTPPDQALALAFANVLRSSLLRGPAASRLLTPRQGWSADIVDPLLAYFRRLGGLWRPGCRLLRLQRRHGKIHLLFANQPEIQAEAVVLAVPAWEAARLLPGLTAPQRYHPIVNLHIAYPGARPPVMAGLLAGMAQWVFLRDQVISVTISVADRLDDWRPERIHAAIVKDLQWLLPRLGHAAPAPNAAWRLVRERRAGFAASFEQWHRRPACDAAGPGILLAGDWVKNPYPATLEGAVYLSESYPHKIGRTSPGERASLLP